MRKNVASQVIGAQLVSATDGSAFTGSVTVAITGDGGTQATGTVGSGACTHEGGGYHTYAPSQAETNYDLIAFTFSGTGAVPVTVQVYTRFDANVTHWLGTAPLALSSQQVQAIVPDSQKVDVNTIKTQTVTLAGGVTIPAATLASTTNITAGTITTTTNLTNAPPDSAGVTTLLSRIPSSLFSGITSLAQWLGLIAGKQTGNTTARTELRATGAGSGTYDETTDSIEALRDRGDAAWVTATGFSTHSAADVWAVGTRSLTILDEDSTTLDLDATIRAAVGLASANLDTQLDALPTAAENTTAVWAAAARTLTALDEDSTTLDLDATIRAAVGLASANLDTQIDALPTTAEVRTQCDDALVAINLDHLVKSAVDTNFATTVHLDSVIGQLADNGTTATFDRTTDSQEAIRDRGDAAWITATGFSTLDAAGVRSAVGLASANLDTQLDALPTAAENADAVWDEARSGHSTTGSFGEYVFADTKLISGDATAADNAEAFFDGTGYAGTNNVIPTVTTVTNRVTANTDQLGGSAQSATDLKDFADTGYDPATHKVQGVVLVDTTTTNSDMRGTDNAALAATALSTAVWTSTRAGYIDNLSAGAVAQAATALSTATWTNTRAGYLDNLAAGAVAQATALSAVASNVADILADTGTDGVVVAAGSKTGYALTSGERDSIAAAVLAAGDVDGFSLEEAQRLCLSALTGILAGAATSEITIKAADGSKVRITAQVDADGNRTSLVLDAA